MKRLLLCTLIFGLFLLCGWGSVAIYFACPGEPAIKFVVMAVFILSLPVTYVVTQSVARTLFIAILVYSMLLMWWWNLGPSNDKDWAADVAQISYGEIDGDQLTMYNVRNFTYESEDQFIEQWETKHYNLENLSGLDLFLSYWASEYIAHTILSWDFGPDGHLAISIETRKDKNQSYSAVKGFFKQFEIAYIAATEDDLIKLRTNFRKERVYAYHLNVAPSEARALLQVYLQEMKSLVATPAFYNALTRNCTTAIQIHANSINPENPPFDWRLIASGHSDSLLYERGRLSKALPFSELRSKSRVDIKMQKIKFGDYSSQLRALLSVD